MTASRKSTARARRTYATEDLLMALCHEVGNLLAATRIAAHLVAKGLLAGPAVVSTAVEIEAETALAGAFLGQVRPLMGAAAVRPSRVTVSEIFAALERNLGPRRGRAAAAHDPSASESARRDRRPRRPPSRAGGAGAECSRGDSPRRRHRRFGAAQRRASRAPDRRQRPAAGARPRGRTRLRDAGGGWRWRSPMRWSGASGEASRSCPARSGPARASS